MTRIGQIVDGFFKTKQREIRPLSAQSVQSVFLFSSLIFLKKSDEPDGGSSLFF